MASIQRLSMSHPQLRVWTERNKKCSLTTDGGMKMNKFLVHSEALALLLTVSIFQQMSADCWYWFHTISSLWPSERLELGPLWWLLMAIVLSQLWLIVINRNTFCLKNRNTYMLYVPDCCAFNQSSARTQRWMICRECHDANLKIPGSTVVLRWKTVQISVSLSRRAGLFKWPSAGRISQV